MRPIFDKAMADFARLRGDWIRRSLNRMVVKVEEIDEGGIWAGRGTEKVRGLVDLWEAMIVVIEVSQASISF